MSIKEFIHNDAELYGALIGTIFADGYISKIRNRYINSCCEFTHTEIHLDYVKLKQELLDMVPDVKTKISPHNKKTENKTYFLYRVSSTCNPYFTEIGKRIYDEHRNKMLPIDEVKKMTDLGLFLMYLDDGSLKIRYYEGTSRIREIRVEFSLDSFTLNEIISFEKYIKDTYGIVMRHYKKSFHGDPNRGFRLWTNTENSNKFMELFDKFYDLVPSMKYKFVKYRLL